MNHDRCSVALEGHLTATYAQKTHAVVADFERIGTTEIDGGARTGLDDEESRRRVDPRADHSMRELESMLSVFTEKLSGENAETSARRDLDVTDVGDVEHDPRDRVGLEPHSERQKASLRARPSAARGLPREDLVAEPFVDRRVAVRPTR